MTLSPTAVLLAVTLLGCGEAFTEVLGAQAASASDTAAGKPAVKPSGTPAAKPAEAPLPTPVAVPAGPRTLLLDGLLNSGFELVADGSTTPPKYGAYWVGACAATVGDPQSLVVAPGDAFRGERCLRLPAGSEVVQKIVAAPGSTGSVRVSVALRGAGAQLALVLEDGSGQSAGVRLVNDGPIMRPVARAEGSLLTAEDLSLLAPQQAQGSAARASGHAAGWRRASFDLGALLRRRLRMPAQPRLVLHLFAIGPEDASVDVDEVTAEVRWPLPSEPELAVYAAGLVRESLSLWFDTPDEGSLGLVDPQSGYVTHGTYDVETGVPGPEEQTAGLHPIHTLLVDWLCEARRRGWQSDVQRWTPELQRCVRTLLEHNFDPDTGLPRLVSLPDNNPQDAAVAVGPWVEFLLDAREQVGDEALAAQCLSQARRIADTLLALQHEHDLSPAEAPPGRWSDALGHIEGNDSNWFGFIPDRLTPQGAIESDKRFDTSWSILTGRSAWHGLLRSPRAIARVHALDGHPQDLSGLSRALTACHRDVAATRYDLENDTDDNYGDLAGDALDIVRHVGGEAPEALALALGETERRLAHDAAHAGDTLWIQAARLGTACPADSPRAFSAPLQLYGLKPEISPQTSGSQLYHDALLELARNDLQGRQLTNAHFTESAFRLWEMECLSYKSTCEGDRREHEALWWEADVGRTFGGPPVSALGAQQAALSVAEAGERLPLLATLGLIRDVTDAGLRRPFGWLCGLDDEVARQYQLPDRFVTGLSHDNGAGLGYVAAWLRLLPCLSSESAPALPVLEVVDGGAALRISGPPGATIVLAQAEGPFATRAAEGDARLLPLDAVAGTEGAWPPKVPLDAQGSAKVARRGAPGTHGWVAPLLTGPTGDTVLAGAAIHF